MNSRYYTTNSNNNNNRIGNLWTEEEEKILLEELKNNINNKEIAQRHERTLKAIEMRIEMIYMKRRKQGMTKNELEILLNKKCDEYEKQFEDYYEKEDKKKNITLRLIYEEIDSLQQKVNHIEKIIEKIYKRVKDEKNKNYNIKENMSLSRK